MENRYEAMDEVTLMETADVFKALGNVTRVKILAVLMERDVVKTPPSDSSSPFDLVFLDPPYRFDPVGIMRMVADMANVGAVSPGALIVYEHSLKSADEVAGAFESINAEVVTAKKYGKTGITTGIISE